MSTSHLTPSKKFQSASFSIIQASQGKIKSQNLRLQLQDRIVDLGNLQTEWSKKQNELRSKSEDLITQLKTVKRKYEIQKDEERAKHLQLVDQLNRQHQMIVLDLQSQINDLIDNDQYDDDDDISGMDLRIENINREIEEYKSYLSRAEEDISHNEEEELNEKFELLEERLNEMKMLYSKAVKDRDDESKLATQQLETLILKQQEIDQQNQDEIHQLVDEINNLDRRHTDDVIEIKRQTKIAKGQISEQLKDSMREAALFQQEISKYQHDHKRKMNEEIDKQSEKKQELSMLNSRHFGYNSEFMNAAKKCSEEKRRIAAMKREIEELKAELQRESNENRILMKEANKIDDEILNQVPENSTSTYSFSFSYNRF